MSDHLPIWIKLKTDFGEEYLKEKAGMDTWPKARTASFPRPREGSKQTSRRLIHGSAPKYVVLRSSVGEGSRQGVESGLLWRSYTDLREESGGLTTKMITAPAINNPAVA